MVYELEAKGLNVQRQVAVPIQYKGLELGSPLRINLLIEELVVVECKAVGENNPLFESQLLTFLRLSGKSIGLVLNFRQKFIKTGIRRVVNGFQEP